MRIRIALITTLIIAVSVLLTACQKKPMGKEFSDVFAQALKKVFGEKVRAAETNHIRISSSIPSSKAAPGPLNRHNLGVLPLSNHVSTTVPLDRNTQCTLTPTLLESGTVQIILTMETTGADGKPVGMNVARVVAHPGEPFDVSIGSLDLAFTPQIAEQ